MAVQLDLLLFVLLEYGVILREDLSTSGREIPRALRFPPKAMCAASCLKHSRSSSACGQVRRKPPAAMVAQNVQSIFSVRLERAAGSSKILASNGLGAADAA